MTQGPDEREPTPERMRAELQAARFLAQAGKTLAQVVDYESTLERIAALAVPAFADWFGVHVREPDGTIRRLAVRHQDPTMEAAVVELYRRYPPGEGKPYGAPQVIASGEPMWLPDFASAIPRVARDAEHVRLLTALGLRSFICVPMRSHGRVFGALTFATAESGRRYDELQLHAAEDLAGRAAVAIENAQLMEALREADRRKNEFLAMLAHELRNPLAPIRNAVDLLRARPALGEQERWVGEVIDRQVRRMSRLVDDLMDISRITNNRIELRVEPIALADVVREAVEASRPGIDAGKHALVIELPEAPVKIEADMVRLSQVMSNLLNNAAKYTPPGGRIAVHARCERGHVEIRVSDNGIGIAESQLEAIFGMFVQSEESRRLSQGGLGIGLTLVRRLVELHGGTVRATSAGRGMGSEFVVSLPLAGPVE
ncbi:MAG TPA: GAF domain-containing sensor histidine kinase [Usitatibacter sp.]|nr:GAF domain-containing sensor histidine kinase [Usitatibacter sp.]